MTEAMREATIEERCESVRQKIKQIEVDVCALTKCREFVVEDSPLNGPNIPASRNSNMLANITLAFRHLEDARMRLGKVMQAFQGGVSIFDKK